MSVMQKLIEAHRDAQIAVNAAFTAANDFVYDSQEYKRADEIADALYDKLVEARITLLVSRPQTEEEARAKAVYVRSTGDFFEVARADAELVSLFDRLCEFNTAPAPAQA
ncbi:hypothetical protein [Xanthobacter autotrophicus]|uniref:hypothetical protein n=1 Tax=Xanthobacter autotrophicus TaxID=280 RepID=UPI0024A74DDA|nr:hypothetical protein [Xanthobacter autotrophicus]MDI4655554.1 hypothetical protein [Xanthobacter autotrophicus]